MAKFLFASALLLVCELAVADETLLCVNQVDKSITVDFVETAHSPFIRLKADRVEMSGFATTIVLGDGSIRYSVKASESHVFILIVEGTTRKAYWSLTLEPIYNCSASE